MDLEHLISMLEEELEGALHYIKLAIEYKAMSADWAKSFVEMSSAELKHADILYKMVQEYYGKITSAYTEVIPKFEHMMTEATEMYTECSAKILYMHETYKRNA